MHTEKPNKMKSKLLYHKCLYHITVMDGILDGITPRIDGKLAEMAKFTAIPCFSRLGP